MIHKIHFVVKTILYVKMRSLFKRKKEYQKVVHPPDFLSHFVPFGQQCRPSSQQTPYKNYHLNQKTK
jgi:hypothetical protein